MDSPDTYHEDVNVSSDHSGDVNVSSDHSDGQNMHEDEAEVDDITRGTSVEGRVSRIGIPDRFCPLEISHKFSN